MGFFDYLKGFCLVATMIGGVLFLGVGLGAVVMVLWNESLWLGIVGVVFLLSALYTLSTLLDS